MSDGTISRNRVRQALNELDLGDRIVSVNMDLHRVIVKRWADYPNGPLTTQVYTVVQGERYEP